MLEPEVLAETGLDDRFEIERVAHLAGMRTGGREVLVDVTTALGGTVEVVTIGGRLVDKVGREASVAA